ncbi:hypothetical protein NW198_02475 [Thermophilibacter sp. ET337]|uniref:hypothetical protein n=1 Tax=Thermophilibacter sp. ET337 TaxID=2973084 RepID=UPI0021AC4EC3|nr:hypothetical protein [Thermophilibacter sp. ET337]MCR8907488.1 hypothetical protein [Thermophilibacter sp. ET337]
MRLVSIDPDYLDLLSSHDREFMRKHGRPCVLVLRLRFRGRKVNFAVPLRSNIAPNVPRDQYFPLPPRPSTKPRHRHGIHYIMMYMHTRDIVSACQAYLEKYEAEGRPRFAVDIDRAIELMGTHR